MTVFINVKDLKKLGNVGAEKAGDTVYVIPEEVTGWNNSRWNADKDSAANYGHSNESVENIVQSYEKHGQLQNVLCRRKEGGGLEVIAGYGRWQAALVYNGRHPKEQMKLKATVVDASDEEAFVLSNVENRDREGTSPIDDAYSHQYMREKFGWTDAKVAEEFKQDPAHVCRLKRLLTLEDRFKALVHVRLIPVQTAYQMAAADKREREAIAKRVEREHQEELKKWKELDGMFPADSEPVPEGPKAPRRKKPTVAETVTEEVRKGRRRKAEAADDNPMEAPAKPAKKPKALARTFDEVKDFMSSLTGEGAEAHVRAFASHFLDFCAGGVSENKYEALLLSMIKPAG